MTARKLILPAFVFVLFACNEASPSVWSLPVKLGDPKADVYAVLGLPTGPPSNPLVSNIQWFSNSGLSIRYDPQGHVATITVHGVGNPNSILLDKPIIYGLKGTDRIDRFLTMLGKPTVVTKNDLDDNLSIYKWRKEPFFITAEFASKEFKWDGRHIPIGAVRDFEISRAIGGQ